MARALREAVARHLADNAAADCASTLDLGCYDKNAAVRVKVAAIAAMFLTSALGVVIPLLGRRFKALDPDGNLFIVTKVFATGVILATAFIHMLPSAMDTLGNPCLPANPWGNFAWAGFIAMLGALGTLVMEFSAMAFYLNRHEWAKPGTIVDKLAVESLEAAQQSLDVPTGSSSCLHVQDGRDDSMFTHARHLIVAQVSFVSGAACGVFFSILLSFAGITEVLVQYVLIDRVVMMQLLV